MRINTFFRLFFSTLLVGLICHAPGSAMNDHSHPIWTDDARILSYTQRTGGLEIEVVLDFKFKKCVQIKTEFSEDKPFKTASERELVDYVIEQMADGLKELELKKTVAQHGPPPGGSIHYEITYESRLSKKGGALTRRPPKILAKKDGVSKGTEYYVLNDHDAKVLIGIIKWATGEVKH